MACNTFICTIIFCLLESSKIILFKDLFGNIFEAKVAENDFIFAFFRDFELNYLLVRLSWMILIDRIGLYK